MFEKESLYIKSFLKKILRAEGIVSVLDVGSSDVTFRSKIQPFIEENVFLPLKRFGCNIYHLDQKKGEGIDIVMDATELHRLDTAFDLVLCFNLLEHVTSISKVIYGLNRVTREGGFLMITVPKKYLYHPDPIDNLFRPDCRTLENAFKRNFTKILCKTITIDDLQIKERLMSFKWIKNKYVFRFNLPQLVSKFEVTLILLRKKRSCVE